MKKEEIKKIQCITCGIETKHEKLWSKTYKWDSEEAGIHGIDVYEAYSCLGCENVTFCKISTNSENFEMIGKDKEGKEIIEYSKSINYYPRRNKRMIKEKYEIWHAPARIRRIYHETIEAYNNELLTVCALGIRAVIEAICIEEGVKTEGLYNKIEELIKKGIITSKLGGGLQECRLLGNESAHQLQIFGDEELLAAINLIENVLESHYIMDNKIKDIKDRKKLISKF